MTAHFGWQNENSANNRGKNTSLANAAANIVATSMAGKRQSKASVWAKVGKLRGNEFVGSKVPVKKSD